MNGIVKNGVIAYWSAFPHIVITNRCMDRERDSVLDSYIGSVAKAEEMQETYETKGSTEKEKPDVIGFAIGEGVLLQQPRISHSTLISSIHLF